MIAIDLYSLLSNVAIVIANHFRSVEMEYKYNKHPLKFDNRYEGIVKLSQLSTNINPYLVL